MEPIDDELADEFDEDEDEDGFPIQRSSDDLPPGNIMSQVPVHWWDSFYISLPLLGETYYFHPVCLSICLSIPKSLYM